MPSFDVVSKLESHEVDNALQQAKKEIAQRFDFKGTNTEIDRNAEGIAIQGDSDGRVAAALKVLEDKLVKRKISLKALDPQKAEPAGGGNVRQLIKLKEGIATERAKEIVKIIKDSKLKVQASIQGDLVRVSGKKRDDLQAAIATIKAHEIDQPLQFVNFRD
jgi:uncharacterized protein YajQ (UPF0234 family)